MLTLPEGFSLHDLRHYLASLLISSGADIKTVQARMRHASARTRLDVYGHLWPDADESTRTAGCCDCRADGLVANCGRPADGLASEPAYMQVKGFADLHVEVQRELRPGRCHGLAVTVAEEPAGQSVGCRSLWNRQKVCCGPTADRGMVRRWLRRALYCATISDVYTKYPSKPCPSTSFTAPTGNR